MAWNFLGMGGILAYAAIAITVIGGGYLSQKFLKLKIPIVNKLVSPKIAMFSGVLLVGLLVWYFALGGSGAAPLDVSGAGLSGGAAVAAGDCVRNPNAATNNFLLAVQNKDNPTLTYLADSAVLVGSDMKTQFTNGNTNAGTTLSYLTLTPQACANGYIIVTTNASEKIAFAADQPQKTYVADGSLGSALGVKALNFNTGADAVANSTGVGIGCAGSQSGGGSNIYVANFTQGSGGSNNFKLQYAVNTSNAQYGAYNDAAGVIFSAYISSLTKFSTTNGITINSIDGGATVTQIPCPADIVSNRKANICWSTSTLKSGRTYTVTGSLNSDLGDPTPGDYIILYTNDVQWAQNNDGSFAKMSYTGSGTNVGDGTDTSVEFLFN